MTLLLLLLYYSAFICKNSFIVSARNRTAQSLTPRHRRMEREAKAKVVASVWGAKFVQFLAPLAVLPRSIWKNMMNSTVSYKSAEAKQLERQEI